MIGEAVSLEGGYISTSTGNLEIGSVTPENRVDLLPHSSGWTFDYQGVNSFADININGTSKIDAGVMGGSNIILTGRNISLGYDLESIADVGYELDDFFTLQPLSEVNDLSNNSVNIIASNTDNTLPSKISIAARKTFSIIQGGNLVSTTIGKGDAGAIDVIADTAIIYGGGFEASSQEDSSGNAGVVTFNVNRMSVQNGGGGVNTLGSGNSGTIDLIYCQ